MILTLEPDLWVVGSGFAGDPVLTAAMLDRLLHHSTIVAISGRELPAQGQAAPAC
jgi:hypothetical protein